MQLNFKVRSTMLWLSGFKLNSFWVPLTFGSRDGRCIERGNLKEQTSNKISST